MSLEGKRCCMVCGAWRDEEEFPADEYSVTAGNGTCTYCMAAKMPTIQHRQAAALERIAVALEAIRIVRARGEW